MNADTTKSRRVAIVTGAGKGIGRACALALAQQGTALLVNNRRHGNEDDCSANQLADEIRKNGGMAVANTDDIEAGDTANNMVAQALQEFGRLDVVVNNAGIGLNKTVKATSSTELREVMEINFFAATALTQASMPALVDSGSGRLIFCISSAALYSGFGISAYAASKAALWAYMRACALESESTGVIVNAVAPFADTQMTTGFIDEAHKARLTPESVAPLLSWLASADCDVTGQTLISAGGKLRVARMGETDSAEYANPQQLSDTARKITLGPFNRHFESASAAFDDIVAD